MPADSLVTSLLGFDMPPAPTFTTLLGRWYFDPLWTVLCLAAAGIYLAGVRRRRAAGTPWPRRRTAAWLSGCATALLATSSSLALYGPVLFSGHVVQQLAVAALAPVCLALGEPGRLARKAFQPSPIPGMRGPLEWLTALTASGPVQTLWRPAFATVLYCLALFGSYAPALLDLQLRSHGAHLIATALFPTVGFLFFSVVTGSDFRLRTGLAMLGVVAAGYAAFGAWLVFGDARLAPTWFEDLGRDWGPDLATDHRLGGVFAWGLGGLSLLIGLWAVVRRRRAAVLEGRSRSPKQDSSI
jgi:putative copper resistance protein D